MPKIYKNNTTSYFNYQQQFELSTGNAQIVDMYNIWDQIFNEDKI